MSRKITWVVLAVGLAMVVMPFAISLPGRASAGQKMIDGFRPLMQPAAVDTTASYYTQTFVPLRAVAQGGVQAAAETPQLMATLAAGLHMTPAQLQQLMQTNFPAFAALLQQFPQLVPVFTKVPPGLDYYKPLVTTMQANVSNYKQIDSLPNFRLFTWFFEVPGALLVLLAASELGAFHGFGLVVHRRRTATAH